MSRQVAVAGVALLVVITGGSAVYSRLRPTETAPAVVEAPRALPVVASAAGEARWTTVPTAVTSQIAYQRVPGVDRPEDVNPAPPQAAAPPVVQAAAPELEPEPPVAPRPVTTEACRRREADPAACRALRQREIRRAQARAQAEARQRPPEAPRPAQPVSSAALGVSPNYDLLQ